MSCGNCGGSHSTDRCRNRDKVIPMRPFVGNFQQQSMDKQRGAKNPPHDNILRPPSMYYDYNNHRQNHQPPSGVQIQRGFQPLNQSQNDRPAQTRPNQDVRFASSTPSPSTPILIELSTQGEPIESQDSQAHLISHGPKISHQVAHLAMPANAVMTRSQRGT